MALKKIILPISFTMLLTFVLILVFFIDVRSELRSQISAAFSFTIQIDGVREEISAWTEDGQHYYVFFPSYAGLSDTTVHLNTTSELFLNGQLLTDDFDLSGLEIGTSYELRYSFYGTAQTAELIFLQSANVATMYIHTETGSMDKIHLNKEYKEKADIILVDAEGNINYVGKGNDRIKGRGNSSWNIYNKKPYTLQLYEASSMLGMETAQKWALLSNATDVSNIRNKLVYDFAEKTSLYWTPDCEYVDLYLNGEYAGLYLLAESIEVSETRLNLNAETYVFEIEMGLEDSRERFSTETGLQIEIKNPAYLTDREIENFQNDIQFIEDSIINHSGDLFENIDLDSWVRKYLIEEIFENVDAAVRSQYFYGDGRSSKVFAGPIWDYDLSLGSQSPAAVVVQNPRCFYASTVYKSADWKTIWYASLCSNEIFYNRLVEIYQSEYLPLLEDLINHDINTLSEQIEKAAVNNNIRWASLFTERRTYKEDVRYIRNFLEERIAFLNHAWIDGVHYCTIQIDSGLERYLYFNVEHGKTIDSLPSPKELGVSDSEVWYQDGTDTVFDVAEPVGKDLFLRIQAASENQAIISSILTKIKSNVFIVMLIAPVGALFIMMLVLLAVDGRRNHRKKVNTYERHQ